MRIIKKYANRKLYDTTDKTYISMDRLADLIKDGEEVSVVDNQTDQDITASVLSQLLAREKRHESPDELSDVLSNLIRKGSSTVMGVARKYSSRWQQAMTMAEDEIEKLTRLVFKEGPDSEKDRKSLKDGLMGQAEKIKHWISEKIDQRIDDVMTAMHLVTREELNAHADRLTALEKRIQAVETAPPTAPRPPGDN